MDEQKCLSKMIAPGQVRPTKPYRGGVIQIHVTRACDKACYACTQGSNLGGKTHFMSPEQFAQAVESLRGYFGVVGVFGGNPATSPHFQEYCRILRESWVPFEQRGIWSNNPLTPEKAAAMRATFNPAYSNLNVHLDRHAYQLFRDYWPEAHPVGLEGDSRHSPPFVALRDVLRKECPGCDGEGSLMFQWAKEACVKSGGRRVLFTGDRAKDGWYYVDGENREIGMKTIGGPCRVCGGAKTVYDEERAHDLISQCDINQRWSAMIGVFRGQLRAWFCEIAGAQSILHQDEPDYPDTGLEIVYDGLPKLFTEGREGAELRWWQLPMSSFTSQVRKHCHSCGVPLRGYGELSQASDESGVEYVSATHAGVYKLKRQRRSLVVVTNPGQIGSLGAPVTNYLQNGRR